VTQDSFVPSETVKLSNLNKNSEGVV
jgi:hypothetical protein